MIKTLAESCVINDIISDMFLPYELSLKLKELKFNEPCLAFYATDPFTKADDMQLKMVKQLPNTPIDACRNSEFGGSIAAPTFQQASDWILLKYGYFISSTYDTYKKLHGAMAGDYYDLYFAGYHATQNIAMIAIIKKMLLLISENLLEGDGKCEK
jgi:hypothetical protein